MNVLTSLFIGLSIASSELILSFWPNTDYKQDADKSLCPQNTITFRRKLYMNVNTILKRILWIIIMYNKYQSLIDFTSVILYHTILDINNYFAKRFDMFKSLYRELFESKS